VLDEESLVSAISDINSVHIIGAGLNKERTAHTAVGEISQRGWRVVPVHPRDAGATVSGSPIRSELEDGIELELVVLFLAPERAQKVVKKLLLKNLHHPPLIWYQPGAEDETSINWLEEAGWKVVYNDCIVRFLERNNMVISKIPLPWFRQVIDSDESGCSIWTVHEFGESSDLPVSKVEWVGDLLELEQSNHIIPKYIRGLVNENEDLENCARRLAN
jgi:predicted CoA-binding protein|tara:strand:+ start:151 stop:804 length:654 start_codon:yes stop_codon:yes gene_type:complete